MKKLMKTILTAAAALALTACSSSASSAASGSAPADQLARIKEAGKIVVGMEGNWQPWTYHDETDTLVGYDVEVAKAIADKLGVEVEFAEGPWDGLFAGMSSGRYDLVVNGVDITEDRLETYDFTDPYIYTHNVLIVRSDNTEITCFEDLKGKKTANSIGSTYMELGEQYGAEVTGVDSLEETLELVLTGRVDATINADMSFQDYMNVYPDAQLKVADVTDDAISIAIPTMKGDDSASLREAINAALAELKADGTLSKLSVKYFGADYTK